MNLKELRAPLIIYWDIDPLYPIKPDIIRQICDDLIRNKIFILNLLNLSPKICIESVSILKILRDKNISVNLTIYYSALDVLLTDDFKPALKKIFVQTESFEQLAAIIDAIQSKINDKDSVGISFSFDERTFKDIPRVLSLCSKNGIRDISFPIQRPAKNRKIMALDQVKTSYLSEEVKCISTKGLNIIIHDPFLWKIFYEGDHEGCQGANTMLYISSNLDVSPCPLLSVGLGNLCSATLGGIFSSERRLEIRKRLAKSPKECESCTERDICRGGCRGRSYVLYNSFDKRDPACLL